MLRYFIVASGFLLAAVAQPQTPHFRVPAVGYIFDDSAKAIRLISGVPGAANLDAPLILDTALDSAFVASRASVAIANTKDGSVSLVRWSGSPQVIALTTSISRARFIAFNSSGDQAAISDGTQVELWSGLSGNPMQSASFTPDGGVQALALSDQGDVAVAGRGGSIVLLGDPVRVLASGGDFKALAFLPGGSQLLAGDAASHTLVLLADGQSSAVVSVAQTPGALAVSADGATAAWMVGGDLALVDLASSKARLIACNCQVASLDRLEGNLVIHIWDGQAGSQMLVDGQTPDAGVAQLLEAGGSR